MALGSLGSRLSRLHRRQAERWIRQSRPRGLGRGEHITRLAADDCRCELASNAVGHSASGERGTFTERVRNGPRWAHVEGGDADAALLPSAARNGWGLGIVAALTDRWGAIGGADGTRTRVRRGHLAA